jgi:hypothetical protein
LSMSNLYYLETDPNARLTLEGVSSHPWVQKGLDSPL